MQLSYVLLAGCALLPTGCSVLMARSGKDLNPLTTQDQVHHEFGLPSAAGTTDGKPYEEFKTRSKLSEMQRSYSMGMGVAMTFGLLETLHPLQHRGRLL